MTTHQYKTVTDFDTDLELEVTAIVQDRVTEFRYKGFRDINQAQRFAKWWEELWYWGYSGHAVAITDTAGNAVVLTSRYNSCD